MGRPEGIEPSYSGSQPDVLPLNYGRHVKVSYETHVAHRIVATGSRVDFIIFYEEISQRNFLIVYLSIFFHSHF